MRKCIPYIIALVVGILAGMWGCRTYYVQRETDMQRDTVFVRDTFEYTREKLVESTKVVHQKDTEYIYIEVRDTVEKEKKVYVPMPRQHYHTRVKDAEIFHSGIESRIDSLNIFSTTANITQTYTPKVRKHALSFRIEANYSTTFNMPMQLEYTYSIKPWLSVYGYAEYELFRKQFGVGAGTQMTIEW